MSEGWLGFVAGGLRLAKGWPPLVQYPPVAVSLHPCHMTHWNIFPLHTTVLAVCVSSWRPDVSESPVLPDPVQSLLTFGVNIFPSNDSHKYVDLPDKVSSTLCVCCACELTCLCGTLWVCTYMCMCMYVYVLLLYMYKCSNALHYIQSFMVACETASFGKSHDTHLDQWSYLPP